MDSASLRSGAGSAGASKGPGAAADLKEALSIVESALEDATAEKQALEDSLRSDLDAARAEIAARDEALEEKAAAKRDLEASLRGDLDAAHAALASRDEALEEMRKDKHYRKQDSLRAYNNAIKKLEATEAERDAGLEAVAALEARLAQAAADLQAAQLPAPAHQRSLSTVEGAYVGAR